MSKSITRQMRASLRRYLMPRRHTAMLCALVAFVAVRPLIGDGSTATVVFSVAVVVLIFSPSMPSRLRSCSGRNPHCKPNTAALRSRGRRLR